MDFNISFYSPRLKFDVLGETRNKGNKVNRSEQVNKSNNHAENPKPKEGVGTWVGKDIKVLTSKFGQADRVPFRDGYKNYVFKDKTVITLFQLNVKKLLQCMLQVRMSMLVR